MGIGLIFCAVAYPDKFLNYLLINLLKINKEPSNYILFNVFGSYVEQIVNLFSSNTTDIPDQSTMLITGLDKDVKLTGSENVNVQCSAGCSYSNTSFEFVIVASIFYFH